MKLFHFDIHIGKHRVLVQSRDIFNNSITGENIAPGAVTAEKIAPGSVGHEQLAPEAVEDLTRLEGELQELVEEARAAAGDARDAAARMLERILEITGDLYRELVGDLTDADIERWFYGPDDEEE